MMKKILLVALVQGLVIFVITGLLCYFMRGDFFFRALAPIFGLAAGEFRFVKAMVTKAFAPSLYEDSEKRNNLFYRQ
ncbi:hypothetical protein [Streptococcus sanguinis]|uniref:hypothetical protein n=1 Tax=Streptococcus sanguinis TaxID=1305 RepID=UPI001CBC6775|nr:hypothetical protein [Streptococcus sanguinis]MBZ2022098.1 hypothetical protein [Streptococcus sanguinis]MBZ2074285.1 hypothetical protein [Streptococcus sanguinis]MBZ2074291.1 hypothetical protein [Streptococcus sanguinis]MBZ2082415.1 hypothetical protein [Streptococcus sanguinis]MBZ2082421.1 hypothetical protein [Streptococcus sanguinis]